MGKVTLNKRTSAQKTDFSHDEMSGAITVIPSASKASTKNFRPPETIKSDFVRLLQHEVPHVNFTFDLIHDWYDHVENVGEHCLIRAQQTPIDWKSKIGNSDMSTNLKVSHDVRIYKGDMVIREDGYVFLLNWMVQNHPNNQATQTILCNTRLTITRMIPAETDMNGYLMHDDMTDVIVDDLPCVHSEYAGRPDFISSQGAAGIAPDHLLNISMQWNRKTRNIRIGDHCKIGNYEYRIINVSIAEVDIDGEHGILILNAKRVAGGYDDQN